MNQLLSNVWESAATAYEHVENWFGGLFQLSGNPLRIEEIQHFVDPRFIPKAPMSSNNIDAATLVNFSQRGYKHAKLITAQTHPEFYQHWALLCSRAGFSKPMQLVLCESEWPNASAHSESEMAMTTGLLKHMTYREVSAILGHELAHARNMNGHRAQHFVTSGSATLLGSVLPLIGKGVAYGDMWVHVRNRGLGMILGSKVGNLAGNKIDGYSSELQADFEGSIISHDPEALASALTKLEAWGEQLPAWRKTWNKINGIHPAVPERVRWLQEVKQQLDTIAPLPPSQVPTLQISGGQTQHEKISTNSPETAISGA